MENEDDVYNVEKIVDSRTVQGKKQYLIKWEGYPDEFNTWESARDIFCKDLIAAYEKEKRDSTTPKRRGRRPGSTASERPHKQVEIGSERSAVKSSRKTSAARTFPERESWEDMIDEVITVQWNVRSKKLEVQFRMKNGNVGTIPAPDAHVHFPLALIRFYERHISFESESAEE